MSTTPSYGIGRFISAPIVTALIVLTLTALLALLSGCNALNPLCGSARPAPMLTSISPTTEAFSQLSASFIVTATGSQFVSSSVMVFNGIAVATTVTSSTKLTGTVTSSMISGPGNFNVTVQTPAGNTSDVGCTSGGTTIAFVLTVN
jgi:hypothetical protein